MAEHKWVTALFADLSGFTGLAERLDPEEVRDLLGRVFGELARAVADYEGHVDKFIGDAAMVLFGVPRAHEDDAVRALLVAREIQHRVSQLSVADDAGAHVRLNMHMGVATGPVLSSDPESELEQIVLGDTVNVASRLTEFAKPGEVVVSEQTYGLTCGQFDFEPLGELEVRGREAPVTAYRVIGLRNDPISVRRLTGLRADLVGRDSELQRLEAAAKRVRRGVGSFVTVIGAAGTGKSRLVADFRGQTRSSGWQWREAHCLAYAEHVPYFALTDMFGRAWGIEPTDRPETVHAKIVAGIRRLKGGDGHAAARMARLFGIESPLLAGLDPESWRQRLYDDTVDLLESLAGERPTVVFIEDVHWADGPSLALLRHVMQQLRRPVLFIATSRTADVSDGLREAARPEERLDQIVLDDLSPDEAVTMASSLLRTREVPEELERFIRLELGGNPFHIEEMINTLVGSGQLVGTGDDWRLTSPLTEASVPLTVRGAVAARLDMLQPVQKRIAQEASVMGRVFNVDVLERVAEHPGQVPEALDELVRLNLVTSSEGDLDGRYAFKHMLTQEAINGSLLREERREIHERVARAMEAAYRDRLPEFYEAIAMHYSNGLSAEKAVEYLAEAGDKSLDRYAVDQAYERYKEAYELAVSLATDQASERRLVEIVVRWARVCYYLGIFRELQGLLERHYTLALASEDCVRAAYEVWFGETLWHRQKVDAACEHLSAGLELAERCEDRQLVGLAHAQLAYALSDNGRIEEAVPHSEEGCVIAREFPHDYYLWEEAFSAAGYVHWCAGRPGPTLDAGCELVAYGEDHGNVRCLGFGHWTLALGYDIDGYFDRAVEENREALRVSTDPWLQQFPKLFMGICTVESGDYEESLRLCQEVIDYSHPRGADTLSIPAAGLVGASLAGLGRLDEGVAMLERSERQLRRDGRIWAHVHARYLLGALYANAATSDTPVSLRLVMNNARFFAFRAVRADAIARRHLEAAAQAADEIGALGTSGECWLALAGLHRARGREGEALRCYDRAASQFGACGARHFAKRVAAERAAVG